MRTRFRDHFSGAAAEYAAFRPRYPDALFAAIAALAPARRLAWDCGTGNGQAAVGLARRFERVLATDASVAQVAAAEPDARVSYAVAAAEASPLRDGAADLVTAATAAHWFDLPRFAAEVRRVTSPGGALAVWAVGLVRIAPAIDAHIDRLYAETLGPWWPPERRLVDERYATLELPIAEAALPPMAMEHPLTLDALGGYLRTWSAALRYAEHHGTDAVGAAIDAMRAHWGDPGSARVARWELFVRAGTVTR